MRKRDARSRIEPIFQERESSPRAEIPDRLVSVSADDTSDCPVFAVARFPFIGLVMVRIGPNVPPYRLHTRQQCLVAPHFKVGCPDVAPHENIHTRQRVQLHRTLMSVVPTSRKYRG